MGWNKALPLRSMEIKTLQESTNQGVDLAAVKPSGGDSILEDRSWSIRLKCGLGIFIIVILTFGYMWVMEKRGKKMQRVEILFGLNTLVLSIPCHVFRHVLVSTCTLLVTGIGMVIWYSSRLKSTAAIHA
jgi:hypothetical protein